MTVKDEMHGSCGKLLLTIVREGLGDRVVDITRNAGAKGGTLAPGRGRSENPVAGFFCVGDFKEEIVLTLVRGEHVRNVMDALRAFGGTSGKHRLGVAVQLDVSQILHRAGKGSATCDLLERSGPMEKRTEQVMITVIVTRGCADDVMSVARKAGATGGTILNARGTASEKDVKFLGIPLFPEKEILIILAETERSANIFNALKDCDCITRPGGGIAFSIAVEDLVWIEKVLE
jgi:nitrogen regulatory protein PII